ncbi:MAG: hypothetical protein KGQ70_06640 [Alphaproteobacteria bacterium]|nr:hypothetical protein [Alphaproteobacteria bacterium]
MKRSLPDPARAAARSFPARTKKTERRAHIFIDLDGVLADFDTHALNEGKYAADAR